MARFEADRRYICSIYPGTLTPVRRHYGVSVAGLGPSRAASSTLFQLKPVPRSICQKSPFVLVVEDSFEQIPNFLGQRGERTPRLVPCEEIVQDLLTQWVGGLFNVPPGARPGVGEISNSVPSVAEMSGLMTQQTSYFEYWFLQGEAIAKQDEGTIKVHGSQITPMMRLAADWLGEKRNWSDPKIARDAVSCPFCKVSIPGDAFVCANCGKTVKELTPELARLAMGGAQTQQPPSAPLVGAK